jgi:hypothetical protein
VAGQPWSSLVQRLWRQRRQCAGAAVLFVGSRLAPTGVSGLVCVPDRLNGSGARP